MNPTTTKPPRNDHAGGGAPTIRRTAPGRSISMFSVTLPDGVLPVAETITVSAGMRVRPPAAGVVRADLPAGQRAERGGHRR